MDVLPNIHNVASLWKRQNSPYWFACFTGPRGERLKKSTKQTDRRKALAVCTEWAHAAKQASQGMFTEAQARKVVSEIMLRATGQGASFQSTQAWLENWLAGKEQSKATNTTTRYRQVTRSFIKHLGPRAQLDVAHVSIRDVQAFRAVQQAEGKSARTCNLAMKIIGAAFNSARRQGFITTNPVEALESLPSKSAARETFTSEQLVALLTVSSGEWRAAIIFGYYTGARLLDVARVRWDAIDLPGRCVRYTPRKTGRELLIPLHSELENCLLEMSCPDNGRAFVFPSLAAKAGKGTGGGHGLSATFNRIMTKAKVAGTFTQPQKGKGRATQTLSFHSLRHSFNSAMANAGVAQELRQKLTGHASAEMNAIYTHHQLGSLRGAIEVIPPIEANKR